MRFITLSRRSCAAVASTVLLTAVFACGGGDDVPGVSGLDGPDRMLSWEGAPVYTVGGLEAPDWAAFGQVARVAFDAEGYLFIRDGQTDIVTVVSPEGDFVGTVGQIGEGPGEIQRAFGMAVMPDGRVVVSDFGSQSLVVYRRDGSWVENVPLDIAEEGLPGSDARPLGDGVVSADVLRFRMTTGDGDTEIRSVEAEGRPLWHYPLTPADTARPVTVAWDPPPPPEGGEAELNAGEGGSQLQIRVQRLQAFEPEVHFAPLVDGGLALVDSTDYRIQILDGDGTPRGTVSRPIPPTRVTEDIEDAERDRRLAELEDERGSGTLRVMGGGNVSIDPAAVRQMFLDQVETMAFYPEIPVVEALDADGYGRLWVQRASGTPGEPGPTDVLTPSGDYVGTLPPDGIRIPDAFGPGGLAAYIELDELDVATVRVVRVPAS